MAITTNEELNEFITGLRKELGKLQKKFAKEGESVESNMSRIAFLLLTEKHHLNYSMEVLEKAKFKGIECGHCGQRYTKREDYYADCTGPWHKCQVEVLEMEEVFFDENGRKIDG